MLYWGLFLDGFDEHHGIDRLASNVEAVRAELLRGREGHVHPRYREVCEHLDRTRGVVPDRFRELCERTFVTQGDAASRWPVDDGAMTVVTALFVLELLPDRDAMGLALGEARRVLAPGGRMIAIFLGETTTWRIRDHQGTCQFVTASDVELHLRSAGFAPVQVERRAATTAVELRQGYSWMLMATASAS